MNRTPIHQACFTPVGFWSKSKFDSWPSTHSWKPVTWCIVPRQRPCKTCISLLCAHFLQDCTKKVVINTKYMKLWIMRSVHTRKLCPSPLAFEQQYHKWLVMSGTHSFSASLLFLSATWRDYRPQNATLYGMSSAVITRSNLLRYYSWNCDDSSKT